MKELVIHNIIKLIESNPSTIKTKEILEYRWESVNNTNENKRMISITFDIFTCELTLASLNENNQLEKKSFNDLDYDIILNIYNHLIIQNYINKIINYF